MYPLEPVMVPLASQCLKNVQIQEPKRVDGANMPLRPTSLRGFPFPIPLLGEGSSPCSPLLSCLHNPTCYAEVVNGSLMIRQ